MKIPWRLVIVLLILTLIGIFAGLNLKPTTINIGFYQFKDVPLFLGLIFSFILGSFIVLPFTIFKKRSKKEEKAKDEAAVSPEENKNQEKKQKKRKEK